VGRHSVDEPLEEENCEHAEEGRIDGKGKHFASAPRDATSSAGAPAVEAAGITKPCRIYDLRSTFASNALAAGVTVFELARVMGTSVAMIEHHYGVLIDGAHAGIVGRLDAIETALEEAAKEATLLN
jgi:hypothetical protein